MRIENQCSHTAVFCDGAVEKEIEKANNDIRTLRSRHKRIPIIPSIPSIPSYVAVGGSPSASLRNQCALVLAPAKYRANKEGKATSLQRRSDRHSLCTGGYAIRHNRT